MSENLKEILSKEKNQVIGKQFIHIMAIRLKILCKTWKTLQTY